MAFTVQAATWETDLLMFSFMSFGGIKYSCSFLYSNAIASARNDSFLVPMITSRPVIPETVKSSDLFWSSVTMVAVLPPKAGRASLLVEEETDFRKLPDSHLPFLSGRGRRNKIRRLDDTFTRAECPPGVCERSK